MQVLFVRHGQTDWNAAGRLQGRTDVPLNPTGERQVQATAQRLAQILHGDVTVVTSHLERARASAAAIGQALGVKPVVDERLQERAYGVWEGLTLAERESRWPVEVARWRAAEEPRIDGYEHHEDVAARVGAAADEHAQRAAGTVVLVSHGSAIRMGVTGLLGLDLHGRTLGGLTNAAWSRLRRHEAGAWTLERHQVVAS